jgi:hypothetical protein
MSGRQSSTCASRRVEDFEIEFIGDFSDGLERIRGKDRAFLIQCNPAPEGLRVTERYRAEAFVVDTFIYPTKALAILTRCEVERPRSLGLVPRPRATSIRPTGRRSSRPIVAEGLLAGRYEAGLTHLEHRADHPDKHRVVEEFGEVDTTCVVYGTKKRFEGDVIGVPSPDLFGRARVAVAG